MVSGQRTYWRPNLLKIVRRVLSVRIRPLVFYFREILLLTIPSTIRMGGSGNSFYSLIIAGMIFTIFRSLLSFLW